MAGGEEVHAPAVSVRIGSGTKAESTVEGEYSRGSRLPTVGANMNMDRETNTSRIKAISITIKKTGCLGRGKVVLGTG